MYLHHSNGDTYSTSDLEEIDVDRSHDYISLFYCSNLFKLQPKLSQLVSVISRRLVVPDLGVVEERLDTLVAFGLRTSCTRQANTNIQRAKFLFCCSTSSFYHILLVNTISHYLSRKFSWQPRIQSSTYSNTTSSSTLFRDIFPDHAQDTFY
jgi:hypothetical protein